MFYSKHPAGFHYQLLAFTKDENRNNLNQIVFLDAAFANQNDSVFWNSHSDFGDKFYLHLKKNDRQNLIEYFLEKANEGDSALLLIPVKAFFKQQFSSSKIPSFSQNDSVVKIYLKIRSIFSPDKADSLQMSWAAIEKRQISDYLREQNIQQNLFDSMGVYWLEGRPADFTIKQNHHHTIELTYKGYLLNGRLFDESPENWQVNPSNPDQMLRGINYVIKYLQIGQSAKIILPSYLAFGEMGSGSIIPPFTPLLYEIKIKNTIN